MSVGVCIINRNGIALAADSAETLAENKMFYNSINKVFSLSEKNICGAIIYGATAIYNVSIEQILKEFSLFLNSKEKIDDFFDIINLFEKFIEDKKIYYKFDVAEKAYCEAIINQLIIEWGNKIKSIIHDLEPQNKIDDYLFTLEQTVEQHQLANFDVSHHIDITYKAKYEEYINSEIPLLNNFSSQKERLWNCVCKWMNCPSQNEINNSMGLFFAGYGQADAFPKYIHVDLLKVFNGKIKYKLIEKYEASNNAKIQPLAQPDVILTFCKGISSTYIDFIPEVTANLINSKIDNLPDSFTSEQKEELKSALSNCKIEILDSLTSKIQDSNVTPLFKSVQLIPLSEMAFLAENLVNITSLRRMYVLDGNQQTVGGPTDVAVLSKGGGFKWVKNKNE